MPKRRVFLSSSRGCFKLVQGMPAKKKISDKPLTGEALFKETCRRIRVARAYWDAHNNRACRGEREKALALYESLTEAQREKVPQVLRVWLRYRSEKYFGPDRTPPRGWAGMTASTKESLHPRNRFRARYDFPRLSIVSPELSPFVRVNPHGDAGIDYADPCAVKALNRALLKDAYSLSDWDLPPGYLCPPIPGRSDYVHYAADLIAARQGGEIRVLDIGTGANGIYPLIGASEYGWRFVGAEVDMVALRWARQLVARNAAMANLIELRHQSSVLKCFDGIIQPGEYFDLTLCNPPFHASAAEAAASTRRKTSHLGGKTGVLNFAGKGTELWCQGGELAFLKRMVAESTVFAAQVGWFTTLVSKRENLGPLEKALRRAQVAEMRVVDMAQGQKKSRMLAWRFAPER